MMPNNVQPMTPNGGNNFMDMFRSQMMTMTMVSSMTGNLLYIFLITQLVDFLTKNLPIFIRLIFNYYKDKIKSSQLANSLSVTINNTVHIKCSSIIIKITVNDSDNIIGQSLMDFITNNNNTKHVSYNKTYFILNQNDIIEISDDIFIKLVDTTSTTDISDQKKPEHIIQTIELFSYTLSMHQLRAFLEKISYEYKLKIQNKLGTDIYYFNQVPQPAIRQMDGSRDFSRLPNNCIFTMKKFFTNRKFENLFGPDIDIIRNRVEFFTKHKKWYDKKGVPYTLGLLLSGQAGAGKTSTIKCLAKETHRHIININLNNDITKNQLDSLFFNENITCFNSVSGKTEQLCIPLDHRIYVLEDIDCQSDIVKDRTLVEKKDAVEKNNKNSKNNTNTNTNTNTNNLTNTNTRSDSDNSQQIDLSFLLNLLDGILETPGRIVIMTSNYPKLLDHALIRPGRIDIIADFKKCTNSTIIEMIEYHYDVKLSESDITLIKSFTEFLVSPAELGKIMFENFHDYNNALSKLIAINLPIIVKNNKVVASTNVVKLESSETDISNKLKRTDVNTDVDPHFDTSFPRNYNNLEQTGKDTSNNIRLSCDEEKDEKKHEEKDEKNLSYKDFKAIDLDNNNVNYKESYKNKDYSKIESSFANDNLFDNNPLDSFEGFNRGNYAKLY